MKRLNIGCGNAYHPAWVNLDFVAHSPEVIECDIRKGLPFADASFDACYSSHVLEHMTRAEAPRLLAEIQRVLKPGGIVRLAVPDFEAVAKDYLSALERAEGGGGASADDYEWMVIQILDQSVRQSPGGEMVKYWRDTARRNDAFVIARAGLEAETLIRQARGALPSPPRRSLAEKIRSKKPAWFINAARRRIAQWLVWLVAGREAALALNEGLFRRSGEIHQWVYDRYSLGKALRDAGFPDPRVCAAETSQIPGFAAYGLDVQDGRVRKPDSLFMEAVKPAKLKEV